MTLIKRVVVAAVLLTLISCLDRDPLGPQADGNTRAILDSQRAGNPYFHWLSPIGTRANSGWTGVLDTSLSPVVDICQLTSTGCQPVATPAVALVSPRKGERHYQARWNTDASSPALSLESTYRIRVHVPGASKQLQLGFADVQLVSSRNQLSSVAPDFVGVVLGSTLDINFRIEQGALGAAVATVEIEPTAYTLTPGSTIPLTAMLKDQAGQLIAGPRRVDWRTLNPTVAGVDQNGVVTGRLEGTAQIVAEAEGQTAMTTITVAEQGTAPPTGPAVIRCTVVVGPTAGVSCASTGVGTATLNGNQLIVGGQRSYVQIAGRNGTYDGSSRLTVEMNVRNLIWQALGTTDGVTVAPAGVRVFFVEGPTATQGSGGITLSTPDGRAEFTQADQPYFQYSQVLEEFAVSTWKTWEFGVPPTVGTFTFDLLLAAPVRFPEGTVAIVPSPATVRAMETQALAAELWDAVGNPVSGDPVSWSSSNDHHATVDASSGVVSALRAGTVQITATSGIRSGQATVQVTGITRTWTGAVSTDWTNVGNWPGGVLPVPEDSVLIPQGLTNYPVLQDNRQVSGVTLENGATLNISTFDLTATGNVVTGTTGGITGSSGRLNLAGNVRTVQGILPRTRVLGTYTLSQNITVSRDINVQLGQLTTSGFRIQQNPF